MRHAFLNCLALSALLLTTATTEAASSAEAAHKRSFVAHAHSTTPSKAKPKPAKNTTKVTTSHPHPKPHKGTSLHQHRVENHRRDIPALITHYAQKHGAPVHLAHGIARTESQYRCNAVSHDGAKGVMQVMPPTAKEVGIHGNLLNCETSIDAGIRYLKVVLEQPHSLCTNLSLYNAGRYARPRCTGYGRKVLAHAREYQREQDAL